MRFSEPGTSILIRPTDLCSPRQLQPARFELAKSLRASVTALAVISCFRVLTYHTDMLEETRKEYGCRGSRRSTSGCRAAYGVGARALLAMCSNAADNVDETIVEEPREEGCYAIAIGTQRPMAHRRCHPRQRHPARAGPVACHDRRLALTHLSPYRQPPIRRKGAMTRRSGPCVQLGPCPLRPSVSRTPQRRGCSMRG